MSAPYDVSKAKREAAAGDLAYLTELAELAEYERKRAQTWFLLAKAMGYETAGRWDAPSPELPVHLQRQVERQRARVRAQILSSPTPTNGFAVGNAAPYFCPACQAVPRAGYCKLAGCPTAPGAGARE